MDIGYFEGRLKRSIQLGMAAVDVCARRSHEGLARLYRQRIRAILAASDILPAATVHKPGEAGGDSHSNARTRMSFVPDAIEVPQERLK